MTVLSRGIKHLDKAYLSGVMTLWKETRTLSEKRVLIYSDGALILSLLEMGKVKIQQISKSHSQLPKRREIMLELKRGGQAEFRQRW